MNNEYYIRVVYNMPKKGKSRKSTKNHNHNKNKNVINIKINTHGKSSRKKGGGGGGKKPDHPPVFSPVITVAPQFPTYPSYPSYQLPYPTAIQAPVKAPVSTFVAGGRWREPHTNENILAFADPTSGDDMGGIPTNIDVGDNMSVSSRSSQRTASIKGIETFHHDDEEFVEVNPSLPELAVENEQFPHTTALARRRGRPPLTQAQKNERAADRQRIAHHARIIQPIVRSIMEEQEYGMIHPPVMSRVQSWEEGQHTPKKFL